MTTIYSCRFCGARVLSSAALTEHLYRCKRVNGWDRHVEDALAVGTRP